AFYKATGIDYNDAGIVPGRVVYGVNSAAPELGEQLLRIDLVLGTPQRHNVYPWFSVTLRSHLVPSPESRFFGVFGEAKVLIILSLPRRFSMIRKVALYAIFALLALSCLDEPDCYNLNNNVIGIAFRKIADNKADTVAIIGITVNGSDSLFHETKLATGVELPVNVLDDEVEFVFQLAGLDGPITRTLRTSYKSRIQFVSEDCGERFIISDLRLEDHDFDSVRLVNDQPGREVTPNYGIYRCPITNRMKISFRQLGTVDSVGAAMDVFLDGISSDFSALVLYPDDTA